MTITIKIAKIIKALPRSGCLNTRKNGTSVLVRAIKNNEALEACGRNEANKFARYMIKNNLNISDGCNLKK